MERLKVMSKAKKRTRKCVICGKEKKTADTNVRMSPLPLEPVRCRKWLQAIGNEDLVYVPIEKLNQLRSVCNAHFSPESYIGVRLNRSAVPTLNLTRKSLPDHLFKDFPYVVHKDSAQRGLKYTTNVRKANSTTTEDEQNEFEFLAISGKPSDVNTDMTSITSVDEEILSNDSVSSNDNTEDISAVSAIPGPSTNQDKPVTISVSVQTEDTRICECVGSNGLHAISSERILEDTSINLNDIESEVLKNLIEAAISNKKKTPQGKRWTMETKVWALCIYKKSPQIYKFLQAALPLPDPKTITRFLKSVQEGAEQLST